MGILKPKRFFSFDDGLAEQQGPFLTVARPILAALMNLDSPSNDEGEGGPDPQVVREMLEDALVLLGNANARLNVWRQRRFSDYLTDLGRRTFREGIPTNRDLFPDQVLQKIKSEHDHKASTSKLICKPKTGPKPWSGSQSFRDSASFKRGQQSGADRKRKWAYQPRGAGATLKYSKTSGGARRTSNSNQSANNTNSSWLSVIGSPIVTFGQSNGKQTRNFLNKLELAHDGQIDSSGCIRVQNTFPQSPASVAGSSDSCPGRTAYGAYERGNSVSNFQGCHFSGESLPTAIHFNTLSSGERTRDRGVPPCDQSKGTKQISSEGEVQNGGAPYCSLSFTQGRLYDETRPAGRPTMRSRYTRSRGNTFVSSSREQLTSSVACHLASPWSHESSPESSVQLSPNCVQRGYEQSSTWTIFSWFTIRRTHWARFSFMWGDFCPAWVS